MISRINRFHGHASLRYVYQHGRTLRSPLVSVKYAPNRRRESYRLAVVVSKKVNKSAVLRNRIRRRLYEAVRRSESQIQEPYDIVITVFSEKLADLPASDIDRLIKTQFKEAGILETAT